MYQSQLRQVPQNVAGHVAIETPNSPNLHAQPRNSGVKLRELFWRIQGRHDDAYGDGWIDR